MSKLDNSGFNPQQRHDIIIAALKEFDRTTACFQLRWRENCGELLDGDILSQTPMFWYMKYKWSRSQIEALFFKARIVIDPVFDMALTQVYGGDPGPRWRGGGGVEKKWRRHQFTEVNRPWKSPEEEKKQKEDDSMNYHINHPNFEYNPVNQDVNFQASGGVNNNKNLNDDSKNDGKGSYNPGNKDLNDNDPSLDSVNLKGIPDKGKWKQASGDTVPIFLETPDGDIVTLNVEPNEKISNVKAQIEYKEKIAISKQRLFFNGKELSNDNDTLSKLGINKNDTIQLSTGPVPVFVKTADGKKTVQVNVDPLVDSVGAIKEQILKKENIAIKDQKIFYKNAEITENENKTLSQFGISKNSVLFLGGTSIPIRVQTPEGKIITLDVEPKDDILTVKKQLESKIGVLVKQQDLLMMDKNDNNNNKKKIVMNDAGTVNYYGLKENDLISLLVRIPIKIKLPDGQYLEIDVLPDDNISDLKDVIEYKKGIAKDAQTLSFKNSEMDNAKSVAFYKLKAGDIVDLSIDDDNPLQLLETIVNRNADAAKRVAAMNKINENLGKKKKYDVLLSGDKIPQLICGFATQILDEDHNKNLVQKTAVENSANVFKQCLTKGKPKNVVVGSLKELLDNLFKILDDPSCRKQHPATRDAIEKIVDDIILVNDPESILCLAGILTEKTMAENITTAKVREFALEQLQKLMWGKKNQLMNSIFNDGAKKNSIKKISESDLPSKKSKERDWLDIGTENKDGPANVMDPKDVGDEFRDIVGDAISTMITDPNRDNSQIGLNIANVMNQLNKGWKDKWLDDEAKRRFNKKYNFEPLKPYNMKMPPKKKLPPKKRQEFKPIDYRIKQQTDVGINAPSIPDI